MVTLPFLTHPQAKSRRQEEEKDQRRLGGSQAPDAQMELQQVPQPQPPPPPPPRRASILDSL